MEVPGVTLGTEGAHRDAGTQYESMRGFENKLVCPGTADLLSYRVVVHRDHS